MTKALCLLIVCLPFAPAASQTHSTWTSVGLGVERLDGSFTDQGQIVTFVLLRIDLKRNHVRVIDTFHEIGKTNAFAAFSLREVWKTTRASIVINAGSTASFSQPIPVGLLQIRGRVINPPNYRAGLGGIFCVMGNRVSIVPLSASVSHCVDAVQRGPVLSLGASLGPDTRYRRTIVAVDTEGRLFILVTREKARLSGVVSFLYKSTPAMNIQSALNLDADVSSGLVMADDGSNKTIEVGTVDGLVASAIAIYKK